MTEDGTVLVIFTDIRGFTKWSEANEVFINLEEFISGFMRILAHRFPEPEFSLKPLGDGALLISVLPDDADERGVNRTLTRALASVVLVETEFARHCEKFARRVGHATDVRLGWGIVRGKAIKMGDEWTGHNLSKCSRLCAEARPFGVVIDRDDFPQLPKGTRRLVSQVRRLRGIGEVAVWVTPEIATQFIPRERIRETPEVHVAGACFVEDARSGIRLLFARRAADRRLFPGMLEGCGGQLRYSETFEDGVRRHFSQELSLDVEVLPAFHTFYEIREPNEPIIPGIRFLCKRVGTGEPASENHSELMWVAENDFANMPAEAFVGDLKHEVMELLKSYKGAEQGTVLG